MFNHDYCDVPLQTDCCCVLVVGLVRALRMCELTGSACLMCQVLVSGLKMLISTAFSHCNTDSDRKTLMMSKARLSSELTGRIRTSSAGCGTFAGMSVLVQYCCSIVFKHI